MHIIGKYTYSFPFAICILVYRADKWQNSLSTRDAMSASPCIKLFYLDTSTCSDWGLSLFEMLPILRFWKIFFWRKFRLVNFCSKNIDNESQTLTNRDAKYFSANQLQSIDTLVSCFQAAADDDLSMFERKIYRLRKSYCSHRLNLILFFFFRKKHTINHKILQNLTLFVFHFSYSFKDVKKKQTNP